VPAVRQLVRLLHLGLPCLAWAAPETVLPRSTLRGSNFNRTELADNVSVELPLEATPRRDQSTSFKSVLYFYTDAQCQNLDQARSSTGISQAWEGTASGNCFSIAVGLGCATDTCHVKMECEYNSGSGIVLQAYSSSPCQGQVPEATPNSRMSLLPHLTWLEAKGLMMGNCTKTNDDGRYMRFTSALHVDEADLFPDCSSQGAVADGEAGSAQAYVSNYYMQFYSDRSCTPGTELQITTFSTVTSNRFKFNIYRGAQHCMDYEDATIRDASFTSAVVNSNKVNFKMLCGNDDTGLGNGIMIRQHNGAVCTGTTQTPLTWASAFYPMNKFHMEDLFNARCVKWGAYFVSMDRPWDTLHYPNCEQYACKSGYCSGGRVNTEYTGATAYAGRETNPTTRAQCLGDCAAKTDASVPVQVLGVTPLLTTLLAALLL